jgi:hypothetical protein
MHDPQALSRYLGTVQRCNSPDYALSVALSKQTMTEREAMAYKRSNTISSVPLR